MSEGAGDLGERRVAFAVAPGPDYTVAQWAIWRAGGVAVPLSLSATEPEWEYTLRDSEASLLLISQDLLERFSTLAQRLAIQTAIVEKAMLEADRPLPSVDGSRRAMILYTSGTTSKPKGVVTTHDNLQAQIESLVEAWAWESSDRIPLFLPLHHIHGIINVMSCALWSGASIEAFGKFDAATILRHIADDRYTVFMAVPTIYVKLVQALEEASDTERTAWTAGFQRLRLMVSGSAALPSSLHQQWSHLTGQELLERYGMTEIGMAISNPYRGERRPGAVGIPLPKVQIRLKNESGEVVTREEEPGEIQVQGPNVFHEYWNRPEATESSFDDDWFKTGDMAVREKGYYRIMGRLSVDIIKSGGYKLSALEIEAALLEHPHIRECAVVGIPDDTWGECVATVVVPDESESGKALDEPSLRNWCRDRLSVYKIPKRVIFMPSLPRNAMGKVTKPSLRSLFETSKLND